MNSSVNHQSRQQNSLVEEARRLVEQQQNDEAIDVLRREGSPDNHASYLLLARAYFQRGDTKGDIYSSYYFAKRSIEFGSTGRLPQAILAMSSLKKKQYKESTDWFSRFVTPESSPDTMFLYSMALYHDVAYQEALQWIKRAVEEKPQETTFQQLQQKIQNALGNGGGIKHAVHIPPTGNIYDSILDHLASRTDNDIDAPYKFNALSKVRGQGTAKKDFYWMEKNVPCQHACPAGTNIPEYLAAIYQGDYDRAYRINLWENIFPAVLGRVCSRPCESECRHGWEGLGDSVAICFSKRSSSDFKNQKEVVLPPIYPKTGKSVAIIGSGVAGLTVARNLALLGHDVMVWEKHSIPGGMMNQGIPEFRLPRDIISREIKQISALGVTIKCNTSIGKDISLEKLLETNDAVVMAAGTLRPNLLSLPGNHFQGICHGLDFLLEANTAPETTHVGKKVIVVGGGFTAMDCARTALRLGADHVRLEDPTYEPDINVVYRRSKSEMLVTPGELEELNHEGIPMDFMVSPVEYLGDKDGFIKGLRLIKTELGAADESGRRRPIPIQGSEFEVEADMILLATGQFPDTSWIDAASQPTVVASDQWLKSGDSVSTENHKLFAAGDFATGALTLIEAIGHAKKCAREVDYFLTGEKRLIDTVTVQDATGPGRIREMDAVPVQEMPVIPLDERLLTAEVETGYAAETAIDETQRCYLCHYKYEIDPDKCIFCDWCIKVKPRPNCIVKVQSLDYDSEGRIIGFHRAEKSEDTSLIYINQEDCIRCNACVEACPVDCISVQKVSLQTLSLDHASCGYDI